MGLVSQNPLLSTFLIKEDYKGNSLSRAGDWEGAADISQNVHVVAADLLTYLLSVK